MACPRHRAARWPSSPATWRAGRWPTRRCRSWAARAFARRRWWSTACAARAARSRCSRTASPKGFLPGLFRSARPGHEAPLRVFDLPNGDPTMQRRHFLLAAMAPLAFGSAAAAPAYPGRPVRIIVGYSAGGPTDQVARMVAAQLQERFGQAFIVENRPGVGSNIASEAVAAAPADGHTPLLAAAPITMNHFVYQGQKFDAEKSFDPISKLSSAPGVLAVRPGLAVNTVAELIALAKSSGGISYGSTGLGGSQHMAAELLQRLTGMALTHVPYKGASGVLSDLIAGHIDMAFMTATSAMPNL